MNIIQKIFFNISLIFEHNDTKLFKDLVKDTYITITEEKLY